MITPKAQLINLYRSNPRDFSREGYLCLDMNEGVPGLPEDFVRRVIADISPEYLASYPKYKRLQERIAQHNQLDPLNILVSNGSDAAIKYIFDAYISPQDKVLLTNPTFAMYPVYCQMFNVETINVEYNADFTLPIEEFIDLISPDIRMLVVINPNNPTGHVLSQDALLAIISKAAEHDVLVVVDEAYYYFYSKTIIQQVRNYPQLIVLRTFSKLCGMAAVRLGYAAACPDIIENLRKVRPTFDVNGIAVLLGERILKDSQIIPTLVKGANGGKQYLLQKLSESQIEYRAGEANFVLIRCHGKAADITGRLAQEKILVSSGFRNDFLKDYVRVTTGSREVMEQFWQAFKRVWEETHKETHV